MSRPSSPPGVLMVSAIFPPDFGGAAVQSLRLAKELISQGVHVEFISDNGARSSIQERYEGVTVTRLGTLFGKPHSKLREFIFALRIAAFGLARPDLEILHFHSMGGFEALIFPWLRLLGRKIVLKTTLVETDDPLAFKSRRFLARAYFAGIRCAHTIIAISRALVERALQAGIAPDKILLVRNGVDIEKYRSASPQQKRLLRDRLGIPQDRFVFLSIGKIEHRKGYDILLPAYAEVARSIPDSVLVIVGPGNDASNPYYRELLETIERLDIPSVRFEGLRSNVEDYFPAADCFWFCSRQEGFGTVLIEAMSCGIPTVAMNIPGVTADLVNDPRVGIITDSEDPAELSRTVVEFLRGIEPGQLNEAADAIRSEFSIRTIADRYRNLYRTLTDSPATPATMEQRP